MRACKTGRGYEAMISLPDDVINSQWVLSDLS